MRTRVIVESPYRGGCAQERHWNTLYVRACMRDALARGEAPMASHALYTLPGVLDEDKPEERRKGINAGFAWWEDAEKVVFYTDLGGSPGMYDAWELAHANEKPVEVRVLGGTWGPFPSDAPASWDPPPPYPHRSAP